MKVHFKHSRKIENKIYSPGIHEVSDELSTHWFFQGLVVSKDVAILEQTSDTLQESKDAALDVSESKPEEEPASKKKSKKKGATSNV